jgi:hypothetical protein
MHLTPNGGVAIRFKMLTYCVYAPLLNRIDALPLNVSCYFSDDFWSRNHPKNVWVIPPEVNTNSSGKMTRSYLSVINLSHSLQAVLSERGYRHNF